MKPDILKEYENMPLIRYTELDRKGIETVDFSRLGDFSGDGVLKACMLEGGKLKQMYTEQGNHVGVIAATRLGKTTGYVIPTIISFAKQKVKKPMIISDPKGEVYRLTAETLRREGYKVKLLNFRDRKHTENWNPLTPVYRKYMQYLHLGDETETVFAGNNLKYKFQGKLYDTKEELDHAVKTEKRYLLEDVYNEIDNIASMIIVPQEHVPDRSWEDGARDLLKGFMHAMLEDTVKIDNPITEETFSIKTLLEIMSTFRMGGGMNDTLDDGGYFSRRSDYSEAKRLVAPLILWTKRGTASSYLSVFNVGIQAFKEVTTKSITSCNSFEMDELTDGGPIAVFVSFKDELKTQYKTISLFVQAAYKHLIEVANGKENGKLDVPFYFILDEFGNFPAMRDFETTISACAGRNIWFILIIQSYAQLEQVYKKDVAAIIKDNLNMHVFFGSNNPETLQAFSDECGKKTIISPMCAMSGDAPYIERFDKETIPLVPVSTLTRFERGECIITEANCGYVMLSKLERFYMCDELKNLPLSYEKDYVGKINPLDDKYTYIYKNDDDDDDDLF